MNERCFGLTRRGECGVLAERDCPGFDRCPFYKPKRRAKEDRERANARLRSLPRVKQLEIAIQYHGGKLPWAAEGGRE